MARIMVPSTPATRGEVDVVDAREVIAGPDGRFYLPSGDSKAEKTRVSDPVEQAAAFAGQPPTKDEQRAAKKEQTAAEKAAAADAATPSTSAAAPADPAAETVVDDPVEAASDAAGDPPGTVPSSNASRDAWAEYAKTQGATDDDLVDADGKPLGRNDLRAKYGLI